ncbi:hypothetical protein GWK47_019385 [Chionoecetes opilio]|uniref:BZIP domain-containing protein n=1 Tax=Chionoecetes opilio TaxID=41210 RepID=A0A8J4XQU3_CHIOP|nr:hypothetical protein GWK47_019385 [Chionoecetes opilio]
MRYARRDNLLSLEVVPVWWPCLWTLAALTTGVPGNLFSFKLLASAGRINGVQWIAASEAPQCFLPVANTRADMQPRCISSLGGTQVKINKTIIPSSSVGTIASMIPNKPVLVIRQSGDWADYLTQEQDMETSITATSTELNSLNDQMIDLGQGACSVIPSSIMGSTEDFMLQGPPVDSAKTAIFDVQSDFWVDSERGMFTLQTEDDLSSLPDVSSRGVDIHSSEKLRPIMPHHSMVNNDLSSECPPLSMHPHESGFVNSVLSSERPLSPSDFIQKHPAPSSQPEDLDVPQHVLAQIDKLFSDMPEDTNWDCAQLDLDLFSQVEEPDALDNIVQECGILNEVEEDSHLHEEETLQKEGHSYQEEETPFHNTTPIASTQLSEFIQHDCVGPVRTRHVRRASRKPARYRENTMDDPATAEVTVKADLEDLVASTSGTVFAPREGSEKEELSNEEKYLRGRKQNNLASKRCREKRKNNMGSMRTELSDMESRNKVLRDKRSEQIKGQPSITNHDAVFIPDVCLVTSVLHRGRYTCGGKAFDR